MVDCGFTAHRRVNLGKQRRRDLYEGHTPLVASRGKAAHVTDDAAAESDQRGIAFAVAANQRVENEIERFPGLVFLTIRKDYGQGRNSALFSVDRNSSR